MFRRLLNIRNQQVKALLIFIEGEMLKVLALTTSDQGKNLLLDQMESKFFILTKTLPMASPRFLLKAQERIGGNSQKVRHYQRAYIS
jgi:hypothetical protein